MSPQGYKNMDLESQDPIFNANMGQDENLIWTKKLRCSQSITLTFFPIRDKTLKLKEMLIFLLFHQKGLPYNGSTSLFVTGESEVQKRLHSIFFPW